MDQKTIKLLFEEIQNIKKALANLVTKDDLKQELAKYATKEDLKQFATKNDLKKFTTKDDLKAMEKRFIKEIRDAEAFTTINADKNKVDKKISNFLSIASIALNRKLLSKLCSYFVS